jgi:transcription elongation factor GreA
MEDIKKKLQEEVAALEYELRNELPKEILRARAHGDAPARPARPWSAS